MTLTVLKSQVGDEATYQAAVEAYREAMYAHTKTEGIPAPVAPSIVESAVKRMQNSSGADDFVVDYEWVNDDPPPPSEAETAAATKASKLAEIRAWEQEAIARVMPPERMRLANLDFARAVRIPVDDRTPEQAALVEKYSADMAAIEDITYEAAQREAELV